ncbi:TPA: hypothetical protein ACV5IO_005621 [Pseudomonas aeruginosa]|uniref:hypothetical protein n=1 Tax=Pseudomonas aeruginosa TaxID=287 RepID=UPI0003BB29B4|nr:hypothetical protein [Pseudomonas aeruginosa]ERZ09682.1 hypothetical protein Q007_06472 [Pseudomonas aeruginosa S54485]MCS8265461.1 hypothetical protein [Pseudomonas aeruginosa]
MNDPTNRTHMKRQPCSPSNSILEGDLELAAQHQIIEKLKVMETPIGFYVIAQFSDKSHILEKHKGSGLPEWFYIVAQMLSEPGKEWYLTTRRDRTSPKVFKDLKRLNDHLKEAYPTESFELVRNQEVPGNPKTKTGEKPAKPKAATRKPATKKGNAQ